MTGSTYYADVDGRVDLVACVSVECILNCKNLFPALEIQKLMFFCKHKRSIVEIYPRKTLQGRVKSGGTELVSYSKCFLPFTIFVQHLLVK